MLRGLYNWTVEKAAHPHAQWWLALFAFVESSFFPIPPHPLLGLMCLAEPKKAIRFALIATVASVVGGMFGYAIGALLYDSIGVWLITKLGYADIFPWAACTVNANGGWAVFTTASTPIPYKLMTITAGFVSMNLATFIIASRSVFTPVTYPRTFIAQARQRPFSPFQTKGTLITFVSKTSTAAMM